MLMIPTLRIVVKMMTIVEKPLILVVLEVAFPQELATIGMDLLVLRMMTVAIGLVIVILYSVHFITHPVLAIVLRANLVVALILIIYVVEMIV